MMDRGTVRNMQSFMPLQICEISSSSWFYYKEILPWRWRSVMVEYRRQNQKFHRTYQFKKQYDYMNIESCPVQFISLVLSQQRYKSTQTQHLNNECSIIYFPKTCFGRSIRPPSGRQHKYINGKVCNARGLVLKISLMQKLNQHLLPIKVQ